jgi:murein DD-endopeptidase MepM/ murein hydrolase activator NlpD
MLFNAVERWWNGGSDRDRPHEGLDIRFFSDYSGKLSNLEPGMKIPVMYEGEVAAIHDDFLGQSVYVHHHSYGNKGAKLYTIYGHTRLGRGVRPGRQLSEGDVFATVAGTVRNKAKVPPHLHISIAWIAESVPSASLDWEIISDPRVTVLIDPLKVVACDYTLLSNG